MINLTEYKLCDLYRMDSGIGTSKEQAGHGAPFISFSDIFNNIILPSELSQKMDTTPEEQEKYSIRKGDILLTRTSETIDELAMSSVALKDYPYATFSGFAKRLRPIQKDITYDKYMAFLLRSKYFRNIINAKTIMTLRASFNEDIFRDIKILLPDYSVQVIIGDFLYNLEKKIQVNNKIINELEKVLKTIYDYWFLQYDFQDEKGNPYKSSGGVMIWNETLKKEIPEGWEVKKVKDVLNVVTGKEDANFAVENGKYNFFTCAKEISKCDKYEFEGKSVLIAGNGDFNVKYFDGKFNAYQRTYVLIPKEEKYVGLIYQSAIRKIDFFKKGSNGSIVKFITKSDIDNIEIIIPKDEKLIDTINSNLNMIQHLKKENEELNDLREFLLPLLMNGQVKL